MAELRKLAAELDLEDARTVGQKGNLVFKDRASSAARLEERLNAAAVRRLGFEIDFFVRLPSELRAVIARNPFRREARRDPAHVLVYFTKRRPTKAGIAALRAALDGPEVIHAGARHLYLYYPKGIGRSKLTSALMDRALQVRGTARNWNTVCRLADVA